MYAKVYAGRTRNIRHLTRCASSQTSRPLCLRTSISPTLLPHKHLTRSASAQASHPLCLRTSISPTLLPHEHLTRSASAQTPHSLCPCSKHLTLSALARNISPALPTLVTSHPLCFRTNISPALLPNKHLSNCKGALPPCKLWINKIS